MKLMVPCNYHMSSKIFKYLNNEPTDFLKSYLDKYEGYAFKQVDTNTWDNSIVKKDGTIEVVDDNFSNMGVIPITKFSSFKDLCSVKAVYEDGTLEVEFGAYPQDLITSIKVKNINKTGKEFNIFVNGEYVQVEEFSCQDIKFIEYNGNFYRVLPVTWIVDVQNDLAVPKSPIVGGIPFSLDSEEKDITEEEFFSKPMRKMNDSIHEEFLDIFLRDYLLKDITTDLEKMKLHEIEEKIMSDRINEGVKEIEERLSKVNHYLNYHNIIYLNPALQARYDRLIGEVKKLLKDIKNGEFDYDDFSMDDIKLDDEMSIIENPVIDIDESYPDEGWDKPYVDEGWDKQYVDEGWDKPFIEEDWGNPLPPENWGNPLPPENWGNPLPPENWGNSLPKEDWSSVVLGNRIDWSMVYAPRVKDENNLTEEEIAKLKEWFDRDVYPYIDKMNVSDEVKQEMYQHIEASKNKYRELVAQQLGEISL